MKAPEEPENQGCHWRSFRESEPRQRQGIFILWPNGRETGPVQWDGFRKRDAFWMPEGERDDGIPIVERAPFVHR